MSAHAEWLTWRAAYYYLSAGKFVGAVQFHLNALTAKVAPVCRATVCIHFESEGLKSLSLETQREATTSRKQVKNEWRTLRLRLQ